MWLKNFAAHSPEWSGRRGMVLWLLYALIVLGSLYRADYITDYNPIDHIFSDTERHWTHGSEDLLRDDPFIMGDPVLYQLYIGALAKLSLKIPGLIAFYTILLSVLMPWFWYRFFRELQPSRLAAVAGWAAITWLPSWISIYGYFMTEALLLPLLGASLWLTWRCKRKRTVNSFLLMVLCWILAGLTRGAAIPMAAMATAWLWLVQDQKIRKVVYSTILLVLILGPLGYRTLEKVHVFAPYGITQLNQIYSRSGNEEINLEYWRDGAVWYFGFWSPSLGSEPFEPLSHWKSRRTGKVKVYIEIEKGREDWNAALRQNDPSSSKYLWLMSENLIFLFFGESWPDSDRERLLGEINYQMRWIWAPLALGILVWSLLWRRRLPGNRTDRLLLGAIMLIWFVIQGLMLYAVNEGRYRKPLEGLLIGQIVLLAGAYGRQAPQQGRQGMEERRRQGDRRRSDRRKGDRRQGDRREQRVSAVAEPE